MGKLRFGLALAALMLAGGSASAAEVKLAYVGEISGSLAVSGGNFRDGIILAVEEINAKGGIMGEKIALSQLDTQTNPGVARSQMQKAIDSDPYAVLGPIFSGNVKATSPLLKQAEIPHFVGGEAGELTSMGDTYLFRTSFGQQIGMPKIANFIRDEIKAKTIALIWVNNDFGKGGRDSMAKALEAQGIKVAADISTDPGQVDFSAAVLKAKQSNADALFVYTNEEESARALRELKKQGFDKPIIGETTLTGQKVIELAGDAANGAVAHVGLTVDAPQPAIKAFDEKFQKEYKYKSDHNGMKGYSGMYVVKAVTEKIGKFDGKAFAKAMHGATIRVKDVPGVLLDVHFDDNGDLDRESFLVKVVGGKQVVTATLPPVQPIP
jgi:branched-chain amino acid transport system substrate-binding protein